MNGLITIGLPSKGRLKEKSLSFFSDSGLKILQSEKERPRQSDCRKVDIGNIKKI